MSRRTGRMFFANPGPTNIPESVSRALVRGSEDFNDPDFVALVQTCRDGLKRLLRGPEEVFIYTGSGHSAWEATMVNLFSPGDTVLMLESGFFSDHWSTMANNLGLVVETVAADRRVGVDPNAVEAALRADSGHRIKAVCAVHNETSTGVALPLAAIRAAMDAAGHPALLLADTISSLVSLDFRMKDWGIDAAVGGSQKGLMLPTGLGFTGVSAKGMEAHRAAKLPRHYFSWSVMQARPFRSFVGTVPTQMFYGMAESLRIIEEEGLDAVLARHTRLAEAVRRAVRAWAGNNGPQLYCRDPARCSDSVTAVLMPEGHDANAIRNTTFAMSNVALGGGLGALNGKVFRIGHLGDLNEAMVIGVLGATELALTRNGVPHGRGGIDAALEWLAA